MDDHPFAKRLFNAFIHSYIGFALFDASDKHLVLSNPAFLTLLGILDPDTSSLKLDDIPGLTSELLTRIDQGEHQRIEAYFDFDELRRDTGFSSGKTGGFFAEIGLWLDHGTDGSPVCYALSVRDISSRRVAEHRLNMLSQAIEQSTSTIVITDTQGFIQYVNPAFTRCSGYSAAEALGRNPRILKSGFMPADVYKRMWQMLEKGEVWKGELLNRRKNGELFWENVSISPVKDLRGRVFQHIAVKEDITEKKLSKGRVDLQHATTRILASEQSFSAAAPRLAAAISHDISCGWVELWELDPSNGDLVCKAYVALPNQAGTLSKPVEVNDRLAHGTDPRQQALRSLGELRFTQPGHLSATAFAIRSSTKLEGVLVLGDLVRNDGSISSLVQGLCIQMGSFIKHLRENRELALLALVTQSLPLLAFVTDNAGRIQWVSTNLEQASGFSQDALRTLAIPLPPLAAGQDERLVTLPFPSQTGTALQLRARIHPCQSPSLPAGHLVFLCEPAGA